MKRICKKCQVEKDLSEYYLKKDGKIKSSLCRICYNEEYKGNKEIKSAYYQNNKEKIYQKNKEWVENNKESREEYIKIWREENKDSIKDKRKVYVEDNKELIDFHKKKWNEDNKEKIKIRQKELYYINHERNRETKNLYRRRREEEDELFLITQRIRCLIINSLKRKFTEKSKKTIDILGCSFEDFKTYLEKKFDENMNWENHGTYWHIDHIKPISLAQNEKEVYELNHYSNLQPLFWLDNLKKSDKY